MCPSYPFIRFHNILCFPRPLIREKTSQRRKQAYRHLGTATQGISERTQNSHLHHNADGGQTEQLPCRY